MTDVTSSMHSIKKPKTNRYPSLNGTDPKFRRNHRHALHGTMKALVCHTFFDSVYKDLELTACAEGGQGGQA